MEARDKCLKRNRFVRMKLNNVASAKPCTRKKRVWRWSSVHLIPPNEKNIWNSWSVLGNHIELQLDAFESPRILHCGQREPRWAILQLGGLHVSSVASGGWRYHRCPDLWLEFKQIQRWTIKYIESTFPPVQYIARCWGACTLSDYFLFLLNCAKSIRGK